MESLSRETLVLADGRPKVLALGYFDIDEDTILDQLRTSSLSGAEIFTLLRVCSAHGDVDAKKVLSDVRNGYYKVLLMSSAIVEEQEEVDSLREIIGQSALLVIVREKEFLDCANSNDPSERVHFLPEWKGVNAYVQVETVEALRGFLQDLFAKELEDPATAGPGHLSTSIRPAERPN